MKILGPARTADVFADWGVHEADGRCVSDDSLPVGFLDQFTGAQRTLEATGVILWKRRPVIASILAANPTEWVTVEVSNADRPSILVMGGKPLAEFSRQKLIEQSPSADWVRSLAASDRNIGGPILAVARRPEGPVTLFDGMHRMAAWVAHLETGRDYPVVITVVVTTDVAPKWELPD